MDVKVGQQIWYVASRKNHPIGRPDTVTKVGTRWAYFGRLKLRFDILNGAVDDGYSSCGRVYASQEEYRETSQRERAWQGLCGAVKSSFRVPVGVSTADIQTAAELLKVAL